MSTIVGSYQWDTIFCIKIFFRKFLIIVFIQNFSYNKEETIL